VPSSLFIVVLTVIALCPTPVSAGIGFQPVPPEEVKLTSEPQAPGAPAIILFREVDRDDNGHTSHEDNYLRIKILTEEGRKYADVEIPFVKGHENVIAIKAHTIRPDGSVVDFGGKVFEKTIVKAKGVKYLAKTFTLPDVQIGSIIEYVYTNDFAEYLLLDSHWILSDELFTKRARFSLKPYAGSDTRWSVRWSWQGLPPARVMGNSPDLILRMAANGAGIVLSEHGSADSYVKAGQLVRVLPEWEVQPAPLWAVFPGRRLMPARTRAFIDALTAKFGGSKKT